MRSEWKYRWKVAYVFSMEWGIPLKGLIGQSRSQELSMTLADGDKCQLPLVHPILARLDANLQPPGRERLRGAIGPFNDAEAISLKVIFQPHRVQARAGFKSIKVRVV